MANKLVKERLLKVIDQCKTQREAAELLNATPQYIYVLTRQFGITKWRQKNRDHSSLKVEQRICEECGEQFPRYVLNNNPGRFCSKECHGRWLGRNFGFKKKYIKPVKP